MCELYFFIFHWIKIFDIWNIYFFHSYRETSFIHFYTFLISLSLEAKFFFSFFRQLFCRLFISLSMTFGVESVILYTFIILKFIYFLMYPSMWKFNNEPSYAFFFMEMCLVEFFDTLWPFKWCAKIMSVVKLYFDFFFYCLENY